MLAHIGSGCFAFHVCNDQHFVYGAACASRRDEYSPRALAGEVAEWSKAHAWNACRRETVSRVRIPLSPPLSVSRHSLRSRLRRGGLTGRRPLGRWEESSNILPNTPPLSVSRHSLRSGFRRGGLSAGARSRLPRPLGSDALPAARLVPASYRSLFLALWRLGFIST